MNMTHTPDITNGASGATRATAEGNRGLFPILHLKKHLISGMLAVLTGIAAQSAWAVTCNLVGWDGLNMTAANGAGDLTNKTCGCGMTVKYIDSAGSCGGSTTRTTTSAAPGSSWAVSATSDYGGGCDLRADVVKESGSCTLSQTSGYGGFSNNGCTQPTETNTLTLDSSGISDPCSILYKAQMTQSIYANPVYVRDVIQFKPTITVTSVPTTAISLSKAVVNSSFTLSATNAEAAASAKGTVSISSVTGNCSLTSQTPGTALAATIAMGATVGGVCTINFAVTAQTAFVAGTKSITVTGVNDQIITITAPGVGTEQEYSTTFTASATSSAGLPVTIVTSGVCSGGGSDSATITMSSGTGTCTLTYSNAGDASHMPATTLTRTVAATKKKQIITFLDQTTPSRLFVLGNTFAISPLATGGASGNAVTYSSSTTGVCTVSGTTVTMVAVGICTIAADQAGNANYEAATQETKNVQLTKALQQISVTTHAPGTKVNGGTFSVAASSFAVATGIATGLPVRIDGQGSCSGGGNSPVTITMTASTGVCTVIYTQAGDTNYEPADPVTEYVLPDNTGGSGCFGEGTYTSLQFNNTGGYIGWACNAGDYVSPGHSVSCSPPVWWNIWPIYQPGWSIQPGIGFKGHVLQTQLNPGKTFQIKKAPGGGDYYNVLNTTDATCLASGNATYESSGTRVGSNSSAGYLVAFQDTATMPSGKYCDYTANQTKWKMNIVGSYATFETAGYPSWPSPGCMGSDSSLALSRRLIAPGDGNYGHWGDSWVRNAAPSCGSGGSKIKCGGYTPPPPDHVRFEFDSSKTYVCGAAVTAKLCTNPAPSIGGTDSCLPFSGYAVLKPLVSKGTWTGLTAAPLTGFTGASTGISLSHTAEGGSPVSLSYSSASMTLTDTALECYDTSSNTRVDCAAAFTYLTCPPFDAVETGAATATNLYTKLAGTTFDFDVVGNPTYTGNLTVDLVDVSAAAACSGGTSLATAAFTAPSASASPITYAFVGGDAGRKKFTVNYADAAAKVAVRMIDKTGACYASSDTFSIRPSRLTLTTNLSGSTATAGAAFTLTATAKNSAAVTTASYAGTPVANDNYIYDWNSASISGMLSGNFDAAVAGVSTGTTFSFSGVGPLTFLIFTDPTLAYLASSVGDTTFTTASEDLKKGDCVAGSYSITLAGGKYGCNIGSTDLVLPRFIPDHYEVDNRLQSPCGGVTNSEGMTGLGGMTYFGQPFKVSPAVSVAAMGADGTVLSNLTSVYTAAHSNKPSFTVEALDGATVKASPATVTPVFMVLTTPFDWSAANGSGGLYVNTSTGLVPRPSITGAATPPNYEDFGLKTTITDSDGVKITKCNGATLATPGSSCTSPPTKMRFGVLKLENAYGSELLPLFVPVKAKYWTTAGWVDNTLDNCTQLTITGAGGNLAQTIVKGPLTLLKLVPSPASLTLAAGVGSLQFAAPGLGFNGSADIAFNLGSAANDVSCNAAHPGTTGLGAPWLRGRWCNNSAFANDPSARLNFGTAKSKFLYMREKY